MAFRLPRIVAWDSNRACELHPAIWALAGIRLQHCLDIHPSISPPFILAFFCGSISSCGIGAPIWVSCSISMDQSVCMQYRDFGATWELSCYRVFDYVFMGQNQRRCIMITAIASTIVPEYEYENSAA